MSKKSVTIGLPHEWETFKVSHSIFLRKLDCLYSLLEKVFIREIASSEPADRVVFYLGRLCVEDFNEILLLCGNGCGIGGLKILRGLYERCVTMGYIAKHDNDASKFLDYHWIHQGKLLNHLGNTFDIKRLFPEKEIERILEKYNDAKSAYEECICKNCNTKRVRFSWSSLDLLSMAREARLDQLYVQCYYEPTLQAHSTVSSLITRMKFVKKGHISFDEGPQRDKATIALSAAHRLTLYVIDIQNSYFRLRLNTLLKECESDFCDVWKTIGKRKQE